MIVWNSGWDKGDRIPSKNLECYTPRPSFWAISAISRCFKDANLCSAKLEFWAPLQDIIGIINANNLKNPFSVLLMQAASKCMHVQRTSLYRRYITWQRPCCNPQNLQQTVACESHDATKSLCKWPHCDHWFHESITISQWYQCDFTMSIGWFVAAECFWLIAFHLYMWSWNVMSIELRQLARSGAWSHHVFRRRGRQREKHQTSSGLNPSSWKAPKSGSQQWHHHTHLCWSCALQKRLLTSQCSVWP